MKMKNDQGAGWCLIPPEIVSRRDLSPNEKLIIGRINGLCVKKGYCFASNNWLAPQFGLSSGTISNIISSLVRKGLIQREVVRNNEGRIVQRRLFTHSIKKWIHINSLVEGSNREVSNRDNANNALSSQKGDRKEKIHSIEKHLKQNPCEYDNINQAIKHYIETYTQITGQPHPNITENQFEVVKDGFLNPTLSDLHNLSLEFFKEVIDDWFQDENVESDYNIIHFASGNVILYHAIKQNLISYGDIHWPE